MAVMDTGALFGVESVWDHCLRQMYSNVVEVVVQNMTIGFKRGGSFSSVSSVADVEKGQKHPLLLSRLFLSSHLCFSLLVHTVPTYILPTYTGSILPWLQTCATC